MRDIKFRVYDNDLHKMRYLTTSHDFICFDENDNGYYHNMQTGLGEWFSDLMQYTGLKDKNGVEIYEGDILEDDGDYYIVKYSNDWGMFVCVFDNIVENFSDVSGKWYEVVGNIYENKELLGN